jgi:hypothetical protein
LNAIDRYLTDTWWANSPIAARGGRRAKTKAHAAESHIVAVSPHVVKPVEAAFCLSQVEIALPSDRHVAHFHPARQLLSWRGPLS